MTKQVLPLADPTGNADIHAIREDIAAGAMEHMDAAQRRTYALMLVGAWEEAYRAAAEMAVLVKQANAARQKIEKAYRAWAEQNGIDVLHLN